MNKFNERFNQIMEKTNTPISEAKIDYVGFANVVIAKDGKISTADLEKFGVPFEVLISVKPDQLLKNAHKILKKYN